MADSNNPMERFRQGIAGAEAPAEPPSQEQLMEEATSAFRKLIAATEEMDAIVKKRFGFQASVTFAYGAVDRQIGSIDGRIISEAPGTSLTGKQTYSIPFTCQVPAIYFARSRYSFPDRSGDSAEKKFLASEQDQAIEFITGNILGFFGG